MQALRSKGWGGFWQWKIPSSCVSMPFSFFEAAVSDVSQGQEL